MADKSWKWSQAALDAANSFSLPQPEPEPAPAPEAGFMDYLSQTGKMLGQIPAITEATAIGAVEGQTGAAGNSAANVRARELLSGVSQATEEARRVLPPGIAREAIEAIPQIGTSLAVLPLSYAGSEAGLAAGTAAAPFLGPAAPAGPVVGGIGGFLGGAAAAYPAIKRSSEYLKGLDFLNQEDARRSAAGLPPASPEEQKAFLDKYAENLSALGTANAWPEALSSAAELTLFRGTTGGLLTRGLKTAAKAVVPDIAGETLTRIGESQAMEGTPQADARTLRYTSPTDIAQAAREVAIPSIVAAGGMGAAMSTAAKAGDVYTQNRNASILKTGLLNTIEGVTPEMQAQWNQVPTAEFNVRAREAAIEILKAKNSTGAIPDTAQVHNFLTTGSWGEVAPAGVAEALPPMGQASFGFEQPSARKALTDKQRLAELEALRPAPVAAPTAPVAPAPTINTNQGVFDFSQLTDEQIINAIPGLGAQAPTAPAPIAPTAPVTEQLELPLKEVQPTKTAVKQREKRAAAHAALVDKLAKIQIAQGVPANEVQLPLDDPLGVIEAVNGDLTRVDDDTLALAGYKAEEFVEGVKTSSRGKTVRDSFHAEQERRVKAGTANLSVLDAVIERLPKSSNVRQTAMLQREKLNRQLSDQIKAQAGRQGVPVPAKGEGLITEETTDATQEGRKPRSVPSELQGTPKERKAKEAGPSDQPRPAAKKREEAPAPAEEKVAREPQRRIVTDKGVKAVEKKEETKPEPKAEAPKAKEEPKGKPVPKHLRPFPAEFRASFTSSPVKFAERAIAALTAKGSEVAYTFSDIKAALQTGVGSDVRYETALKETIKEEDKIKLGLKKPAKEVKPKPEQKAPVDPDEMTDEEYEAWREKNPGKLSRKARKGRNEARTERVKAETKEEKAPVKEQSDNEKKYTAGVKSALGRALDAEGVSPEEKAKILATVRVEEVKYTPTELEQKHMDLVGAKTGSKVVPVRIIAGEGAGVINGLNLGLKQGENVILYNVEGANATIATIGHEAAHDLQNDKEAWKIIEDATGIKGVEKSADLFGQMVVLSPKYVYEGIAQEASKRGKLAKVFDSILGALDRVLGIGVEDKALMKQLSTARKAARDAYVKYSKEGAERTAVEEKLSRGAQNERPNDDVFARTGRYSELARKVGANAGLVVQAEVAKDQVGLEIERKRLEDLISELRSTKEGETLYGALWHHIARALPTGVKMSPRQFVYSMDGLYRAWNESALPEVGAAEQEKLDLDTPEKLSRLAPLDSTYAAFKENNGKGNANAPKTENEWAIAMKRHKTEADAIRNTRGGKTYQDITDAINESAVAWGLRPATTDVAKESLAKIKEMLGSKASRTTTKNIAQEAADMAFDIAGGVNAKSQEYASKAIRGAKNPKIAKSAAWQKSLPWLLKVMPTQEIVRNFVGSLPILRQYEIDLGNYTGSANGPKEEMTLTLKKLKNDKERMAFSKAGNFATNHQIDPSKPFEQQDLVKKFKEGVEKHWVSSGMREKTGKSFKEGYNEGVKLYKELGENGPLLIEVSKKLDQLWEDKKQALYARVANSTKEDSQPRAKLLNLVDQYTKNTPGLYFPLARFGNYFVVADNTRTGEQAVWTFESAFEQQEHVDKIKADQTYTNVTTRYRPDTTTATRAKESNIADFISKAGIKIEQVNGEAASLEIKRLEKMLGRKLDGKEKAQVVEENSQATTDLIGELQSLYLQSATQSSTLKNANKREYVEGHSEDLIRAVNDYTERFANDVAKTKYMYKLREHLASAEAVNRDEERKGENRNTEGKVVAQLKENLHLVENVPSNPIASGFSKVASAMYMSSPSVFMMQMSQLGVVTWPKLVATFSSASAASALAKGIGRAFDSDLSVNALVQNKKIKDLYNDLYAERTYAMHKESGGKVGDFILSDERRDKRIRALDDKTQKQLLVYTAIRRNIIGTTFAYDVGNEARGQKGTGVFNAMMFFMRQGEEKSRLAALLAGHELYLKERGETWDGALENTRHQVTNDTLFDYSPAGRPDVMLRNPILKVATQFRFFQLMFMSRLTRLLMNSTTDKAARKEIAGMAAASMILAGVAGTVPFALIDMIWKLGLDDDDDEVFSSAQALRNFSTSTLGTGLAGTVFSFGLPGAVGMDVSRRIGVSDTVGMAEDVSPVHLKGSAKVDQLATRWALGPSWGVIRDSFKAYEKASEGEYGEAMRAGAPKMFRDVFKALESFDKDGTVYTTAGKKLTEAGALNEWELLLLATGHNPVDYVVPREKEYVKTQLTGKLASYASQLNKEYAKAWKEQDHDAMAEVLKQAQSIRMKHPEVRFNFAGAIRDLRRKEMGYETPRERMIERKLERS